MRKNARKITACLLVFGMMTAGVGGTDSREVTAANEGDTQTYVITTKTKEEHERLEDTYEDQIVESYAGYEEAENKLICAELTPAQAQELKQDKEIEAVEKNSMFRASGRGAEANQKKKSRDADSYNWNFKIIGAKKDQSYHPGEKNRIKIAVMDSGIDVSEDVRVAERVNLVDEEKQIAPYYEDITSHGTSIAGIIADINPDAEIYSVRVLDAKNTATLERVVEGIYWCIEHDIDVINMSFGTTADRTALKSAVRDAEEAGILMVGAVGNSGKDTVEYPAAYDGVIAVGGVDKTAVKTKESGTGEQVELMAPGSQLLTDGAYGGSMITGGTSMSAAHVTAAASVIWQKDKSKPPVFVRGLLNQSAKKLGCQNEYGNGLVNIKYAIKNYRKYEKNYRETMSGGEEEIIPANEEAVETFDEVDLVEGRWSTTGHKSLIDGANADVGFTYNEMLIIKDACAKVDGIGGPGYDVSIDSEYHFAHNTRHVLHGRYNYVSTIDFLYKVARKVYETADAKTVAACCNEAIGSYKPDTRNTSVDSNIKNNMVSAVQFMSAASTPITDIGSLPWKQRRGLRLLGMVLHVVGDTYAHKAKLPASRLNPDEDAEEIIRDNYAIYASDLKTPKDVNGERELPVDKNLEEFRKEVSGDGMMFARITRWMKDGVIKYEDVPGFFGNRYNAAHQVSRMILRYFAVKSPTVDVAGLFQNEAVYENGFMVEENNLAYFYWHVESLYGHNRAIEAANYSFDPQFGEYIKDVNLKFRKDY